MAAAERRSGSETGSGGGGVSAAGGEQDQAQAVHESAIRTAEVNGDWPGELKPKRVVFPDGGKRRSWQNYRYGDPWQSGMRAMASR